MRNVREQTPQEEHSLSFSIIIPLSHVSEAGYLVTSDGEGNSM